MAVTDDDNGGQDAGAALLALAALRTASDRAEAILDGQSPYGQSLSGAADDIAARALLKIVIGADVQAYSAFLKVLAGLPVTPNAALCTNGDGQPDLSTLTGFGRQLNALTGTPALKALLSLAIADVAGLGSALGLKADLVNGQIPLGQIPVLPSQKQIPSSGLLADLTAQQQADIGQGTVVTTTDGFRYVYKGTGSKTDAASYIALADITPTIAAVEGLVAALSGKQAQDADLDAIAALPTQNYGRSLLTLVSAAAGLQALGVVDANGYLIGDGRNLTNLPSQAAAYRAIGDAAATLLATDRIVATSATLTASRTWTLPLANAVPAGTRLIVSDLVGGVSSAFPLVLARSGSDTLNGATSHSIVTPNAELALLSDGISKWAFDIRGVGRGGTGATTPAQALINLGGLAKAGDILTGALDEAAPVTLASAATVDIGAAASNIVDITGTTTITSFGTRQAGAVRRVRFLASGLVVTYNATSLILPGSASITTQAGDTAEFRSLGGGNWMCRQYQRADGKALIASATSGASGLFLNGDRLISADATITSADNGKLIVVTATAGTSITLSVDTAANLGANFSCGIRRQDGVIAPVALSQAAGIDGRASLPIYQESFILKSDGSTLRTFGRRRGPVLLGSAAASSASLAAITIGHGFTDPEMTGERIDMSRLSLAAGAQLFLRVTKGGTLLTESGYARYGISSDAGGGLRAAPGGGASIGVTYGNATSPISVALDILGLNKADPVFQTCRIAAYGSDTSMTASFSQNATGAVESLTLYATNANNGNTVNITDYAYTLTGIRA